MTKIVEWCNKDKEKNLKPIELIRFIQENHTSNASSSTKTYNNVSLVSKREDSHYTYDLICCWNTPGEKLFYWGYWNDGIV